MLLKFTFILVEPAVAENTGAAARALKTMGFDRLAIVNSDVHKRPEARWLAHGSTDILDNALVYDSLQDAVRDADLVIGTTAKRRRIHADHYSCTELPGIIRAREGMTTDVSLVFGREESGLTNEELSLCHIFSVVPMMVQYPSLNLAQAVMIYTWELSKLLQPGKSQSAKRPSAEKYHHLRIQVAGLLELLKLDSRGALFNRIMERLEVVGDKDAGLIMSVAKKIEEELGKKDKGVNSE